MSAQPLTLPAAQSLALRLNGRFLTISSAEENQFIAEQARGVTLWMSGWRPADRSLEWRDERNRPLRYLAHWGQHQPNSWGEMEWNLGVITAGRKAEWHDFASFAEGLHACVEWGEE